MQTLYEALLDAGSGIACEALEIWIGAAGRGVDVTRTPGTDGLARAYGLATPDYRPEALVLAVQTYFALIVKLIVGKALAGRSGYPSPKNEVPTTGSGLRDRLEQLEAGRFEVENQYSRSVRREGNQPAQKLIQEVFCVVHRKWRGVGEIPGSGLGLGAAYSDYDAERRFGVASLRVEEPAVLSPITLSLR